MKRTAYLMCCLAIGSAAMMFTHPAKAQATDDDKKFLAEASQGNYDEIQLGKLAEKMKPYATEWGLAAPTGLSPDAQKEYDKLQGMSGTDFDKEYISDMVTD